jgi:hypothetical protein
MSKVKEFSRNELVQTILDNTKKELTGVKTIETVDNSTKDSIETILESTKEFLDTLSYDELTVMVEAI